MFYTALLLVASAFVPEGGATMVRSTHSAPGITRVFVFAGQSNMVGADSKVRDIERFPPYAGLGEPQKGVQFHYCLGRETKQQSDGWTTLAPIADYVGPELSFARMVTEHTGDKVAIIKVAAGGTTLGADWNPEEPSGFELYPLALRRVKEALAALDKKGKDWRLEGVMWHQGENDMFNDAFKAAYGANLKRFVAAWRRDLDAPELPFYIGEHCTKTVWGMDNRRSMHAIETGQREVTDADPLAFYVPTAHVGVEIGGQTGMHYHYGTLGQLQHGESYAEAYLAQTGEAAEQKRALKRWPYADGSEVTLFVLAGHRNMEGERAFVQDLDGRRGSKRLKKDVPSIAYRYSIGGGFRVSDGWEPLGPAGFSDTFGPELSFAASLGKRVKGGVAIAKYTHSGSQIVDWTPDGSAAATRNLYPGFLAFVRESVAELEAKGHTVRIGGVFYHLGENDTAWGTHRRQAADWVQSIVAATRRDLAMPELRWFVSQQEPAGHDGVKEIDVVAAVAAMASTDPFLEHVKAFDLPGREQALVLTTAGVVALGETMAAAYLAAR